MDFNDLVIQTNQPQVSSNQPQVSSDPTTYDRWTYISVIGDVDEIPVSEAIDRRTMEQEYQRIKKLNSGICYYKLSAIVLLGLMLLSIFIIWFTTPIK